MAEERDGAPPPPSDPSQQTLAYLQHLQARIQPLTRSAAQLPGSSDLHFHRSLDKSLAHDLDEIKNDVLQTINGLLACVITPSGSSNSVNAVQLDDLIEPGAFERKLGDAIDTLLEKTDTRLDEFQGKVSVRAPTRSSRNPVAAEASTPVGPLPPHILNAPIRPLPQQRFSKQPDNSRERAWQHSLDSKPHAQVPLTWRAPSLQLADGGGHRVGVRQGMYCAEGDPRDNPYYYEINNLAPPEHALVPLEMDALRPPPPLNKDDASGGPIPFTWVSDKEAFDELYAHLMEERVLEVAVDVEHHNYRSYQGLVCLVQISTRWHDYIIDALSPTIREHSHKLNDVFADPNKVKVLHGAEHDILWLQRDLRIYVVGLFDTFHATNVLNFTQHGLAFLLHRYIDFVADKRYQLADWRIRPLPKEMLFYARSDTHSLLYVYDCLRFEIAQQFGPTGIRTVFDNSKRTASKTYAKEEWSDGNESREGWRIMWKRLGGADAIGVDERWVSGGGEGNGDPASAADNLTKTERLFRALHDWRDQTARAMDESPRYVLSSANLLNLSSRAPDTRESVVSCVGPALKKRAGELLKVIEDETSAYEAAQARKAARQRELLEMAAAGQLGGGDEDDEMGEVLERGGGAAKRTQLWPVVESAAEAPSTQTPPSQPSTTSKLARWLFPTSSASASEPSSESAAKLSKRASIFTPISRTQSSQRLVDSIRQDLTYALRGVFRRPSLPVDASGDHDVDNDDGDEDATTGNNAVESVEVFSSASSSEEQPAGAAVDASDADADADGILEIRRKVKGKKKDKKRIAGRDSTAGDAGDVDASSPAPKEGRKRKWTKEEKAERKRLQQESAAASSSVAPFDYSNAVSVLDAKPPPTTPYAKKKRGDKAKEKADNDGGSASASQKTSKASDDGKSPRGQGRYANVSVGRDRREQAGGKSKTFSR